MSTSLPFSGMQQNNAQLIGIESQIRKELFDVCCMWKNTTRTWTNFKFCKIILWFTSRNNIYIYNIWFYFYAHYMIYVRYLTKIFELTHSTVFYWKVYEQSLTIKKLNCQILPMHIHIFFIILKENLHHHIIWCTYEIEK